MYAGRHAGRVALVTGAGSGIGRAVALRLACEGAHVIGSDLRADRLDETLAEIRDAGAEATMVAGDISVPEGARAAAAAALGPEGRCEVLANVAGVNDWFLPAHEVDDETWARVMAVNVTGPMMLCRALLPSMMEGGAGAIVNIASVGALGGGASGVAYTASKHALIGLTRSVAWTYREAGVRCNAVCPGGVATNIGETSVPRSDWGYGRLRPVHEALAGRIAEPDEIAALVSWLASDEASNVNGAIITADNGWRAA